jgi:hypothetical protein
MAKQYAAGHIDDEAAVLLMDGIGATDDVDQAHLLAALAVIRESGAELPAEPKPTNGEKPSDPATDAQLALIARLVKEKSAAAPDLPLTKADAHEVIDTLKAGTYDGAKWTVPF